MGAVRKSLPHGPQAETHSEDIHPYKHMSKLLVEGTPTSYTQHRGSKGLTHKRAICVVIRLRAMHTYIWKTHSYHLGRLASHDPARGSVNQGSDSLGFTETNPSPGAGGRWGEEGQGNDLRHPDRLGACHRATASSKYACKTKRSPKYGERGGGHPISSSPTAAQPPPPPCWKGAPAPGTNPNVTRARAHTCSRATHLHPLLYRICPIRRLERGGQRGRQGMMTAGQKPAQASSQRLT